MGIGRGRGRSLHDARREDGALRGKIADLSKLYLSIALFGLARLNCRLHQSRWSRGGCVDGQSAEGYYC
jgi:hypothetical protein